MFVHPLPELVSGGSELSEKIGVIAYTPIYLVEALLFFVVLLGSLVVFSVDILAQRLTSLSSISS